MSTGEGAVDAPSCGCSPDAACGEAEAPAPARPRRVWTGREGLRTWVSVGLLLVGLLVEIFGSGRATVALGGYVLGVADAFLLAAVVVGAASIVRNGVTALRRREFNIDLLETVAILAATALGMFVEAALLAVLISAAHRLEAYAVVRTRASLNDLLDLSPETARVRRDGDIETVPPEDVAVGETVVVKPGERIPLDGTVVEGTSAVDESPITGESTPVDKTAGSEVYAGTLTADGYLEVETTAAAGDTTLARIIDLVREARENRSEFERYVDRLAAYYTPAIVGLAVLVAAVPPLALGGPWRVWFVRGLTLVVIACPCAFVISTPVSVFSAITSAANHGVLVKGGTHLEALGDLDAVAFDKTGTLTTGDLTVTDVIPADGIDQSALLRLAGGIEARSEHPVAEAVVDYAREEGATLADVDEFEALPGSGVRAAVDGTTYYLGKPSLFAGGLAGDGEPFSDGSAMADGGAGAVADGPDSRSAPGTDSQFAGGFDASHVQACRREGETVVLLGTETRVLGAIALADDLRPDAKRAVERLQTMGVETVMLTGDSQAAARAVADELGIDEYRADLLPEEKIDAVSDLESARGTTAMVGDGINDAPALAAAAVGIAMGAAGTDTAIETADVALMGDDLERLPYAHSLAASGRGVIKQNVWGSLLVEGLLSVAAPLGLVGPVLAVLFGDAGLTLLVTGNALRLSRVSPESSDRE